MNDGFVAVVVIFIVVVLTIFVFAMNAWNPIAL